MKNAFLVVILGALAASCSCGPTRASCSTSADCPIGQTCSGGACYATNGIGGGSATGGGAATGGGIPGLGGGIPGLGGGSGGGSGQGGGTASLTPCVNLQCQQADCAATHTGCVAQSCSGTTSVSGVVYEPGGQLPIYNVTVYVPNAAVQPFGARGVCEACGAEVTGSPLAIALTDNQGRFTLNNVPAGSNVPLVMQIGRWRRQVTIPTVTACTNTALTDRNVTRLPRNHTEGDLPLMAIASGKADPFECLLLKMGISSSEFTPPSGGGRVNFYTENGLTMTNSPAGSTLTSNANTLNPYDVVFLPCEGNENTKTVTQMQNVENYVNSGGRLFVTHYGYVWTAFAPSPFKDTAQWMPDTNGVNAPPDPVTVTVNQGFAKGVAFATWLQNVGAANNGALALSQSRYDVGVVHPGSTAWMKGDASGSTSGSNYNWTPHLTFTMPFNPPMQADGGAGPTCGRVVFSDFHVTTSAVSPLSTKFPTACIGGSYTPQEKALVFMVFDLSSCVQDDSKPPTVCTGIGGNCNSASDCCSGLTCQNGAAVTCTNGGPGCQCQAMIQ